MKKTLLSLLNVPTIIFVVWNAVILCGTFPHAFQLPSRAPCDLNFYVSLIGRALVLPEIILFAVGPIWLMRKEKYPHALLLAFVGALVSFCWAFELGATPSIYDDICLDVELKFT